MRDTTERPEGVEAGILRLVGTSKNGIVKAMKELIENQEVYRSMANAVNPYGDGTASKQIIKIISNKVSL